MTEIEQKALALVNEMEEALNLASRTTALGNGFMTMCLCRAIEQHEAFRRDVSDAVDAYFRTGNYLGKFNDILARFIIPLPVDPLLEVIGTALRIGSPFDEDDGYDYAAEAACILSAMKARGYEFTKIGDGA